MKNFNLLKIKSDSGKCYIFDALSNNIYEIESESDWENLNITDLGYESDIRKDSLIFEGMDKSAQTNAKTLIIELTEACNIRCTYCIFDESDKTERNHGEETTSEDMAFKSIDDFFKRTNGEEAYIVFYGGEPLLNYPLIKRMVAYGNEISNKKIKFSFTTNGISLTKEKFAFLIENEFKITVSVDGPEHIHDKRRLTKNGRGTFSIIEKNLIELVNFDNDFYYENVEFNCTISDFCDVTHINDFFNNSTLFRKESVRFAPIISNSINLGKEISLSITDSDLRAALNGRSSILFKSKNHEVKENVDPVQDAFMGEIVRKIKHRKLDEEAASGKKICVPFANRTYVRANGETQFCERIQSYGVLKEQDDLAHLSASLHKDFYDFKADSCSKCFAYNFCEMCPASFIANGALNNDISIRKCDEYRDSVARAMKVYINSMEANN